MDGPWPSSTEALVHLDGLPGDHWELVLEEILRVDSNVLGVESVSYWRFRPSSSSLVCELGYHGSAQSFDRGFELLRTNSPGYFDEIQRNPVLAIEDAARDDRTRDIRTYLSSRKIGALLDTAIRTGGHAVGVLCHEHRGGPRTWSEQDRHFAFAVGQIVSTRLASRARSRAEERERRSTLLADVMADVAKSFGSAAAAARVAVEKALPMVGEMSTLVAFNGAELRHVTNAHIHPQGRALLDDLTRRYPPALDGPGLASHAVREQQSLLVPNASPEAMRNYGVEDRYYEEMAPLNIRSAMATPFSLHGSTRGAMLFASSFRRYGQDELKFAERYAQRIGLVLDNAWLYETAQEAIQSRDEFLSLASHELRTPLTSLWLFAHEIAREAAALPAPSLAYMGQRMVRQAGRMERLAERLLNASEIAAGGPSISRESVDLAEIVNDVILSFSGTAKAAGIPLLFSGDDHVIGDIDPVRVEEVLSNLIDNAIKFGMGKPIEVELRQLDGDAVISVRDHGPGIPSAEQEEVFQRYWRGTAARGLGGLGLGLHVVRELVESHGGHVRLDTRAGEGSTFTVELPLHPVESARVARDRRE